MDPAQGETQGKSITSKLKAKVKGVKGKVHLPGHKKRQGGGGGGGGEDAQGGDSSSGYSSDDSPRKPGPETGYNVGASTPFTTVRTIPLSPARETEKKPPSYYGEPPRSTPQDVHSTTESMAKMGHDEDLSKPREGMLGKVKDTVGGAAAAVGSTMGYYTEVDRAPVEPPPPADPNAPTMVEKAKHSLGLDKPSDPNAPTMVEKAKHSLGLDRPTDPNAPTMMEKAKATLGLDKPSNPNAPTLMEKTKASLGMGASPGAHPAGAADMQSTFPAQTDYVPPVPHQSYGDRIGEERPTIIPTGGYNQTVNRY